MKRRGYTLTEMMVVMACMTAMFAMSADILLRLWSTVRETQEQMEVAAAMSRLSTQFREDVHQATAVEITDSCKLTHEDGRDVFYIVYGDRLARVEAEGKNTVARESFRLPTDAVVAFSQSNVGESQFVEVKLAQQRPAVEKKSPQLLLALRSCLGRGGLPKQAAEDSP